jgi:hypothetical protein
MGWTGHVARTEGRRNAYKFVLVKAERKALGRLRHRCECNFDMHVQDMGCNGVERVILDYNGAT